MKQRRCERLGSPLFKPSDSPEHWGLYCEATVMPMSVFILLPYPCPFKMMTGERRWEPTGSGGSLIPDVLMSEVDWACREKTACGKR